MIIDIILYQFFKHRELHFFKFYKSITSGNNSRYNTCLKLQGDVKNRYNYKFVIGFSRHYSKHGFYDFVGLRDLSHYYNSEIFNFSNEDLQALS